MELLQHKFKCQRTHSTLALEKNPSQIRRSCFIVLPLPQRMKNISKLNAFLRRSAGIVYHVLSALST